MQWGGPAIFADPPHNMRHNGEDDPVAQDVDCLKQGLNQLHGTLSTEWGRVTNMEEQMKQMMGMMAKVTAHLNQTNPPPPVPDGTSSMSQAEH